jgi:hypothetical protein
MATTSETQAVIEEVRKTRDTAARLANGEATDDADHVRVLAGMIQKLAEQVGRLAGDGQAASPASAGGDSQVDEAPVEEDRTPQDAPADPANSAAEERP